MADNKKEEVKRDLNDLELLKKQWKIMTERYFKLLEREGRRLPPPPIPEDKKE